MDREHGVAFDEEDVADAGHFFLWLSFSTDEASGCQLGNIGGEDSKRITIATADFRDIALR
jgi:hypothetical protein